MKYIFFIFFFVLGINLIHADVLRDDTSKVEVRQFDEKKIEKFRKNSRYDYHTKESWLKKVWRKLMEWLGKIGGQKMQKVAEQSGGSSVLNALLAVAAVILVIFGLSKIKFKSWITGKGASVQQEYTVEEENIHEIEFDKDIRDAEKEGDYRRAIRLYFLKVLKNLSDNEMIYWDPNKTNYQYIYEVKGTNIHNPFVKCVRIFDNVWYGEYPVDIHYYNNNKPLFEELSKDSLKIKTAVFNG
jgi:hypothetical protein